MHTEFNSARYQTTLFIQFWFRKNMTTFDKTHLYIYNNDKMSQR